MSIAYYNNEPKRVDDLYVGPKRVDLLYNGEDFVWDLRKNTMFNARRHNTRGYEYGFGFDIVKGARFDGYMRGNTGNIAEKGRATYVYNGAIGFLGSNNTIYATGAGINHVFWAENMSGAWDYSGGAYRLNAFNMSNVPYRTWNPVISKDDTEKWSLEYVPEMHYMNRDMFEHMFLYTKSMFGTFSNQRNLRGEPVCGPQVTNMRLCYNTCYNITGRPAVGQKVVDMSSAYYACNNLSGEPRCPDSVVEFGFAYWGSGVTGDGACGDNVVNMSNAYRNCQGLTGNLYCGNNVKTMSYAYYNCRNAGKDAFIGASVEDATWAFDNCRSIRRAFIYGGINLHNAFSNCMSLLTVSEIPRSVRTLSGTFANCKNLVSAPMLHSGLENVSAAFAYSGITIPPVFEYGIRSLFQVCLHCANLVQAPVIPASVVNLDGAFNNCPNIRGEVHFPMTSYVEGSSHGFTNRRSGGPNLDVYCDPGSAWYPILEGSGTWWRINTSSNKVTRQRATNGMLFYSSTPPEVDNNFTIEW